MWGSSTLASRNATPAPTPPPPDDSEPHLIGDDGVEGAIGGSVSAPPSPARSVHHTIDYPPYRDDDCCDCFRYRGDPTSLALLRYCRTRGATKEFPDAGVGGGASFLVLSQALGDMCLQASSDCVGGPKRGGFYTRS